MGKAKSVVDIEARTKGYDQPIKNAVKLLQDFGKQGPMALAPLLGSWAKLVPAAAAAVGGMKTFQKVIGSTQTLTDQYGRVQKELNASINSFFSSIARGDMSGFISGLKDVAKYAKQAYNTLDDLGTFNIFKGAELSEIDQERARLTAEIKSGTRVSSTKNADGSWSSEIIQLTKDEMAERKRQLEEVDKKRLNIVASSYEKEGNAYRDVLKTTLAEGGFKGSEKEMEDAIDYYLKGYRDYDKAAARLKELNEKIAANQTETITTVGAGGVGGGTQIVKQTDNALAAQVRSSNEYKQLTAIVEIGDQNLQEAMQHRIAAAQASQEMNRMLQKDAKTTGAGGGNGTPYSNKGERITAPGISSLAVTGAASITGPASTAGYKATEEDIINLGKAIGEAQIDFEDFQKSMQVEGIYAAADAFGALGNAIGGTAGQILELIGTMAQQVTQAVVTITSLKAEEAAYKEKMTAAAGAAAADAMAAHSSIPFVGVAIGVGMVATIIATLMSLPKFAEGGVVGGTSDTGDKILARVNSGEGILTKKGMNNLANLVQGSGIQSGTVRFEIEGRKLVGVLNSEENRQNYRP